MVVVASAELAVEFGGGAWVERAIAFGLGVC